MSNEWEVWLRCERARDRCSADLQHTSARTLAASLALFSYINSLSTHSECWNTGLPWRFPTALGNGPALFRHESHLPAQRLLPLSLCIPHVLSLFMTWSKKSQWVRSSNGGELVELCSALWVLILGVSHVSEMVRESKCVSHLQINQICHMNAYLRSWWEDTV